MEERKNGVSIPGRSMKFRLEMYTQATDQLTPWSIFPGVKWTAQEYDNRTHIAPRLWIFSQAIMAHTEKILTVTA